MSNNAGTIIKGFFGARSGPVYKSEMEEYISKVAHLIDYVDKFEELFKGENKTFASKIVPQVIAINKYIGSLKENFEDLKSAIKSKDEDEIHNWMDQCGRDFNFIVDQMQLYGEKFSILGKSGREIIRINKDMINSMPYSTPNVDNELALSIKDEERLDALAENCESLVSLIRLAAADGGKGINVELEKDAATLMDNIDATGTKIEKLVNTVIVTFRTLRLSMVEMNALLLDVAEREKRIVRGTDELKAKSKILQDTIKEGYRETSSGVNSVGGATEEISNSTARTHIMSDARHKYGVDVANATPRGRRNPDETITRAELEARDK